MFKKMIVCFVILSAVCSSAQAQFANEVQDVTVIFKNPRYPVASHFWLQFPQNGQATRAMQGLASEDRVRGELEQIRAIGYGNVKVEVIDSSKKSITYRVEFIGKKAGINQPPIFGYGANCSVVVKTIQNGTRGK